MNEVLRTIARPEVEEATVIDHRGRVVAAGDTRVIGTWRGTAPLGGAVSMGCLVVAGSYVLLLPPRRRRRLRRRRRRRRPLLVLPFVLAALERAAG